MNKRERTQAARLNAAQELQTIANVAGNFPSVEECFSFLARVRRYAYADARYWEQDNSENAYKRYYNPDGTPKQSWKHKSELLKARRMLLESELHDMTGGYCTLHNYGLYPTIETVNHRDLFLLVFE